jgi:hypothetical protein
MMCKVHVISTSSRFIQLSVTKSTLMDGQHVSKIYKHVMIIAHDQNST